MIQADRRKYHLEIFLRLPGKEEVKIEDRWSDDMPALTYELKQDERAQEGLITFKLTEPTDEEP